MTRDVNLLIGMLSDEDGQLAHHGMLESRPQRGIDFRLGEADTDLCYFDTVYGSKPVADHPHVDFKNALERFCGITTPPDVVDFAREFGPLRTCLHGLPATHTQLPILENSSKDDLFMDWMMGAISCPADTRFSADGTEYHHTVEPINAWMDWVEKIRAGLRLIYEMRERFPASAGSLTDWQIFLEDYPVGLNSMIDKREGVSLRFLLSSRITYMLKLADVHPIYHDWWNPERDPDYVAPIEWKTTTFGALVIQLLGVARNARNLAICDYCGRPYGVARKPRAGARHACDEEKCQREYAADRKRAQRSNPSKGGKK